MNFKEYNRNQNLLLPPNFSAFLGESHEAVVLAEFIDSLDLTSLEESYSNDSGGRRAYHPVMLLSVLIYGYMNGTFSSRKIAKRLRQDLAYMYLSGSSTPDFRTLARFRKEKGACLETALKHVVDKARGLGFISFGTVSLDGTKIRANACRDKNETRPALEEKIRSLLQEAEDIDEMEDELYGDLEDAEAPELKTKAGRAKKRQELQEKREKTEAHLNELATRPRARSSGKPKINTTDPDSRPMKMKRGDFANGYNVQIMTENGLVLSSCLANNPADQSLLIPTVHAFKRMHNTEPKRLLADKGYSSEDNYAFCERENIDAYIPVHKEPIDLAKYAHDKKEDTYTNKLGHVFRFKQRMIRRKQGLGRQAGARTNGTRKTIVYEHIDEATKKKKYLCVSHEWQRYAKEQREKLASSRGRERYGQRMHDVEGAFANIKHNMRFTAFRLRGFEGVANEWNLISLAHNLRKIL